LSAADEDTLHLSPAPLTTLLLVHYHAFALEFSPKKSKKPGFCLRGFCANPLKKKKRKHIFYGKFFVFQNYFGLIDRDGVVFANICFQVTEPYFNI
jgi:hypothetical protein